MKKKMPIVVHKKMKLPKMGGGFAEGSPGEEMGESAATESSEGGMKRGGMVNGKFGHKPLSLDSKHGHKAMSHDGKHGHKEM